MYPQAPVQDQVATHSMGIGNACIPNFLRNTAGSKGSNARAVHSCRELEQIRLVVADREDGEVQLGWALDTV